MTEEKKIKKKEKASDDESRKCSCGCGLDLKPRKTPYWDIDAQDLGSGWKSFDWFGSFYDNTDTPWIYHEHLGWLYRSGETVDDTWLWSEHWDWSWTSDLIYPYLAKSNLDWIYYLPNSQNPVRFYDYGLSQWMSSQP